MKSNFQDRSVDIDVSFIPNPVSRDLKTRKNKDSILQHIDLLLMQEEDSLIGRPGVCAGLKSMLFESFSVHEVNVIKAKIRNTLSFEPRISVEEIEVSASGHSVLIRVEFIFIETRKKFVYESTLRRVL